ncbi:MAG: hypothetical protein Q8L65_04415 [Burkholderiales bacterium]|nr:hypothetical protein [Burkholderiales bacterium]MDP2398087.1 hypothetical protein [Burkholderiales bacterium]
MQTTQDSNRWILDYEVEQATGGRITASRLRHDRVKQQIFPFHRVGRSVFYDMAEINALIEASRYGGKAA